MGNKRAAGNTLVCLGPIATDISWNAKKSQLKLLWSTG
jgi:hypothetical protein